MDIEDLLGSLREGTRFQRPLDDAAWQLRLIPAPSVLLATSVLVIEDVDQDLVYDEHHDRVQECRLELTPGEWAVRLAVLHRDDVEFDTTVACIVGRPDAVVTWEAPTTDQRRFSTEYGLVGMYDAARRPALVRVLKEDEAAFDHISEQISQSGSAALLDAQGATLLTVFMCHGSGEYDVWRGLDSCGQPLCVVADMDEIGAFAPVD